MNNLNKKKILVTGGLGFIGINLVLKLLNHDYEILNIDYQTYAANKKFKSKLNSFKNYSFAKIDICNQKKVEKAINDFCPAYIFHLAAESHVDNSINNAKIFLDTNIYGTYNLLESVKNYQIKKKKKITFHHISTDEVYGSLHKNDRKFSEKSNYDPSSPYSSSKASSDMLVKSWGKTHDIEFIITHCSNNYGPFQNKEKFIPKIISSCIKKNIIPVYGNGKNIRDWIYVSDHIDALIAILNSSIRNTTLNIGGNLELENLELVNNICSIYTKNFEPNFNFKSLIKFVADRPGHDLRYAVNNRRIKKLLGWRPMTNFDEGILNTIKWYQQENV